MSTAAASPPVGRPLRLLALDGGGVRGLVTLLILRRLMYLMNPKSPPRPCDVFDVMAGTSTGGLIAIMLGRLEMDIEEAIKAYTQMSKLIFVPRRRNFVLGSRFQNLVGNSTFDHEALERAVKKIVLEKTGSKDTPLYQTDSKCKIFVCASMLNSSTRRLRSYPSSLEEPINCTIWEAARATSAAPTFFDPITFSDGSTFRDGALRDNNPIFQLINEVTAEYPGCEISTIVSLGTGVSSTIVLGKDLISVAEACVKIATDAESQDEAFTETYTGPQGKFRDQYFRFNVDRGLQEVGLEEWDKVDMMQANTMSYLGRAGQRERLTGCASSLRGPHAETELEVVENGYNRSSLTVDHGSPNPNRRDRSPSPYSDQSTPDISGSIVYIPRPERATPNQHPFYQLDFIDKRPVGYFAPREELSRLEHVLDPTFLSRLPVQIVSLVGLGGSGKTQLMLQYASQHRDEYGVVLWFDASSEAALEESVFFAASHLGLIPMSTAGHSLESTALVRFQSPLDSNTALLKRELRRRKQRWLILVDQADDMAMIRCLPRFLPSNPAGDVIVSSRRQEAARLGSLGDCWIEVKGLSASSAQQLLLRQARIDWPSAEDIESAEKIVKLLDCIALAVELAGRYIPTLDDGPAEYLRLYQSHQRGELMMDSIGNDDEAPHSTGYAMSVFTAWKISVDTLPRDASNFLYLLCFLDRTNLTKDLFKRACTPKYAWNNKGELAVLQPRVNHVPEWLLQLFCSPDSGWNDLKFNGVVKRISDLFFLRKEKYEGPLMHQSGTIDSSTVTSDGSHPVILVLPQPLHDLGKFYLSKDRRRQYSCDAFSVVVHAFPNDLVLNRSADKSTVPILHTGLGGRMVSRQKLVIGLEEIFRHVNALKEHAAPANLSASDPESQLWPSTPMLQQAEAILLASMYWPSLQFISERPTPWPLLVTLPQIILGQTQTKGLRRWDATYKGDKLEDDTPELTDREDNLRIERMLGSSLRTLSAGSNGLLRPSYDPAEDDEEFNRSWIARNVAYHVNLDRSLKGYMVSVGNKTTHLVDMKTLAETTKANIIYHVAVAAEWRAHHLPEWTLKDELLDPWMIKATSTIGKWSKFTDFNVKAHKTWLLTEMSLDFTIRCGEQSDIPLLEAERRNLLEDKSWEEEPMDVIPDVAENAEDGAEASTKSASPVESGRGSPEPVSADDLRLFIIRGRAARSASMSSSISRYISPSRSATRERRYISPSRSPTPERGYMIPPRPSWMKRIRLRLRKLTRRSQHRENVPTF